MYALCFSNHFHTLIGFRSILDPLLTFRACQRAAFCCNSPTAACNRTFLKCTLRRYYVRTIKKPKARAAVSLAVKVGSVAERDTEQGVAHILEHLAFSATQNYDSHRIVAFLESIGASFGACQNASTSADETIYELLIPTDDPVHLTQAFSVLAEFATKIR